MKQPFFRRRKLSRRQWIMVSGAALLAVLIAGVVWQEYSWRQYTARHDTQVAQLGGEAQQRLQAVTTTDELQQLSSWLSDAAAASCQAPALTELRMTVSSAAATYQATCQQFQEDVTIASQAVVELEHYLRSDRQLADVLSKATDQLKKIDSAAYADRQKVWSETAGQLKALTVVEAARPLQDAQLTAATAIATEYQSLAKASAAKDRADFDTASDALTKAYGVLTDTTEQAQAVYQPIAQQLIDRIADL